MSVILDILLRENISYAIVKEIYNFPLHIENDNNYRKDVDIVVNCRRKDVIDKIKQNSNLVLIEKNSFFDKTIQTRVDVYFKSLNVGYYHYLTIDRKSFEEKKTQDLEYLIYIIIDPLLKFSRYKKRHQYMFSKYFKSIDNSSLHLKLSQIIGKVLSEILLGKLRKEEFYISNIFIKMCKFRMLFINGNFGAMLKNRLLNARKVYT
jgi:hypothetical protein